MLGYWCDCLNNLIFTEIFQVVHYASYNNESSSKANSIVFNFSDFHFLSHMVACYMTQWA